MSIVIRILLMIGAVGLFLFVHRGVRNARLKVQETFFWLLLTVVFILLSAFPEIAGALAGFLGIMSPINLVFLVIIFLLLIKLFTMDRRLAKTEHQLIQMTQKIAIDKFEESDNKKA